MTAADIAARHQLHRAGRDWRGDCPSCGYANAFSVRDGQAGPLLFCASCRDGPALAVAVDLPRRDRHPAPADREAERTRKRAAALEFWQRTAPSSGTSASTYLSARGVGHLAGWPDLRFRGECRHPSGDRFPALVALVRDPGGEPMAVHRTYLQRDGSGKADIEPAKASFGPVWGGAIRLGPIAAEIVVGEGIESAAAAGLLAKLPAWAALSAGNLATGLELPTGIRAVVIAVDRDPAGERAATAATARWRGEGRHIRHLRPDRAGDDASDVLRSLRAWEAANA